MTLDEVALELARIEGGIRFHREWGISGTTAITSLSDEALDRLKMLRNTIALELFHTAAMKRIHEHQ